MPMYSITNDRKAGSYGVVLPGGTKYVYPGQTIELEMTPDQAVNAEAENITVVPVDAQAPEPVEGLTQVDPGEQADAGENAPEPSGDADDDAGSGEGNEGEEGGEGDGAPETPDQAVNAEVLLAMAEDKDVHFSTFKAAASAFLGESCPSKKGEIVEALKTAGKASE